ncbi:DUF3973 domain-containing protein [Paenibacillus sedimenti]|uniref:DUF3973 domain-containing protein n=1 Tax=Paenibacillus sedimenti TaxID=2770274 RepID=A0A926KNG1_9BACL|nr:DUF3973 domain-containing protein [Paenibacillus sedimenti]
MNNNYYCIQCHKLHLRIYSVEENVLKSGFHFVDSNLYSVGICNKLEENQKSHLLIPSEE